MSTIYDYSVPVFSAMLKNLSGVLSVAAANAKERRIDEHVFLSARLAPDMLPLVSQIQIACDHAKNAPCRLAGIDYPSWPDEENSFAELEDRIGRTRDHLKALDRNAFEGADERRIDLKIGGLELSFDGMNYLNRFAMPNFQFHCTAAYLILRHNGVPLGKKNYLGG